jgi:hypothetical protein
MDRRTRVVRDEAGVIAKFGVPPASIPDYLALVGDAADGYPGLRGGARNRPPPCSRNRAHRIDPRRLADVEPSTRPSPARLAKTLAAERDRALLFRTLATCARTFRYSIRLTFCSGRGPTRRSRPSRPSWIRWNPA